MTNNDDVTQKLIAACKAAVRCLESIERNEESITAAVRKGDSLLDAACVSTFHGWRRNLEHARKVLQSLDRE